MSGLCDACGEIHADPVPCDADNDVYDEELMYCPDCGRSDCTGENCYWPDEAGLR